jgi:hypothetical protein
MNRSEVVLFALAVIAICVSSLALYRARELDAFAWRLVRQNSDTTDIVVEYLGEVQELRSRLDRLERTKK